MKRALPIVLMIVVSSTLVFSATPQNTNPNFETKMFSTQAQVGDTSFNFVSPNSRVLNATVNHGDLTLTIVGKLAPRGQSRIEFTAERPDGVVESATLVLSAAKSGQFSDLSSVARIVGLDSAFEIAQIALDLEEEGMVPGYQAHYLVAAMGAIASESENPAKVAWPWEYAAYGVCYYACVAGCETGCGFGGCGSWCWTMCENQCGHYIS